MCRVASFLISHVNDQANAEVAKEFNATAVNSIEELLAADVDAVYIATPANLHYEQVIACAKAGKHILCEKPLGMNINETEKMIAFCKEANVILATAFMMRFQSQHQQALQMIKNGKLGKPVLGRAQLSCWYPPIEGAWRQNPANGGGGLLMDMGGHFVLICWKCSSARLKRSAVSLIIQFMIINLKIVPVVNLFFENGSMGVVDTFFCIPDNSSKNVLELYGSGEIFLAKNTIGQGGI